MSQTQIDSGTQVFNNIREVVDGNAVDAEIRIKNLEDSGSGSDPSKLPLAGGTMSGDIDMDGNSILNATGLITAVNAASDLGTPVGGYYQLPAGHYVFNESIVWGTNGIDLIDSNSTYRLASPLLKMQTYTGTNPFLKSTGTDNITFLDHMSFSTPNAIAVEVTTGGSLLTQICLFLGCKQVHNLVDLGFLTVGAVAMVDCDTGIVADGVGISTVNRLQWSSGADLSGVAYTALGASSQRLIFLGNETEAAATEAIFDIQATFGGLMSNTGGAHSFGTYFKAGSRDQTDASIESYHCIGTDDSQFIGSASVQDNTTATSIGSVDVFVPFNLNSLAIAGDNIERWSMTDNNTAELTCDVDGFAGTLNATLSTTGSGSSSEYHFRVVKNGVQVNGVIANELAGDMGNTFLSVPIEANAGDVFVVQVANHDNTSNITLRYGDINIA